jgi:hypothetical protein
VSVNVTKSATSTQQGVTVHLNAAPSQATAHPGQKVDFPITAWASAGKEKGTITATVRDTNHTSGLTSPTFIIGCGSKTSCTFSPLPTKEPTTPQAEAQLTIPNNVRTGDQVTVAFKMTVSPEPSPSPSASPSRSKAATGGTSAGATPAATNSGTSGTTYGLGAGLPIGPLPSVGAAGVPGISTTIPGGNASNLFPQINPTPSPAPGTQADPAKGGAQPVADSSTIPLSLGSSEFGAQIIGLLMLLLGVVIAVTRISLRKARTVGKGGTGN